jgi:hypothetical protein
MARPTVLVPLDRTMQFPLTLAGGSDDVRRGCGWRRLWVNCRPIATNDQGIQQKRRAVLIVEDDAELRSLTAPLFPSMCERVNIDLGRVPVHHLQPIAM